MASLSFGLAVLSAFLWTAFAGYRRVSLSLAQWQHSSASKQRKRLQLARNGTSASVFQGTHPVSTVVLLVLLTHALKL